MKKEIKEIDIDDKLEWLIKTLIESKHKTDMMDVLNDTYELYKNN